MAAPKGEMLLAEAVRSGQFAPVYCLHGDNEFRKDEAVRQIVAAATEDTTRAFNVDVLRAGEADAATLEVSLATLPLMGERRVVILRDPGTLKKHARSALERHLADPSPETILVLVVPRESDVPDWIGKHAVPVALENLSEERLTRWIVRQARTLYDAEMEPAAAKLLQEIVGPDLNDLSGELDKLASYAQGRQIDSEAIAAVVGVRAGETVLDLVDAVVGRDHAAALALVTPVLRQPRVTGVSVVMSLTVHMLGVGWCCARREAGANTRTLEREAHAIARRVPYFLTTRPAQANAGAWARVSGHWSSADIDAALAALLAADMALKETRVASDEQVVATAVLAVCAGADRRAAA